MRLFNLNIEHGKHDKERVLPFLKANFLSAGFDVICMQEVNQTSFGRYEELFKIRGLVGKMLDMGTPKTSNPEGLAIFCRDKNASFSSALLAETDTSLFTKNDRTNSAVTALLTVEFEIDAVKYTVHTTHMPVTIGGLIITDFQRQIHERLYQELNQYDQFILTGDFNTARGGELYDRLAQKYNDNVPHQVTTTIDGDLHRAGSLPFVVDGLFTTNAYQVENPHLLSALSDHLAITADIKKVR